MTVEGLAKGREYGIAQGFDEGRELGLDYGIKLGLEVGYYSACLQTWHQLVNLSPSSYPQRLQIG